jgi:hypothetical protein
MARDDQRQQQQQSQGPQRLGQRHQARARSPVSQQAQRHGQEQKRQRLDGGQQTDFTGPGLEQEHRHDGHSGQAQLLGRLGQQIGPSQTAKRGGQDDRHAGGFEQKHPQDASNKGFLFWARPKAQHVA